MPDVGNHLGILKTRRVLVFAQLRIKEKRFPKVAGSDPDLPQQTRWNKLYQGALKHTKRVQPSGFSCLVQVMGSHAEKSLLLAQNEFEN